MPDLPIPPFDAITEAALGEMIDRFYRSVREDPVLGPVFEAAIAADDWPAHLVTMRRFWSSVMLASGAYSGNPVEVHRSVAGLERPMFARWLALFEANAAALFTPGAAARVMNKAQRIAGSLQIAVFHRLGAPPDGLPLRAGTPECA